MTRGPVRLTTLEEDFREIGILRDEAKKDPSGKTPPPPKEEPEPKKEPGKEEEEPEEEGKKAKPKAEGEEPAEGEPVDEARRSFTKIDKSATARKARRIARLKSRRKRSQKRKESKRWRKTARGRRYAREYGKAAKKLHGKRPVGKRMHVQLGAKRKAAREGVETLDRAAMMVEETRSILSDLVGSDMTEAMRSFANVAIISELLSRAFTYFGEKHDDEDYDDAADLMSEMADDAAEIAEHLKNAVSESEAVDLSSLTEEFETMMEALQLALEDYAEMEPELEEEEDDSDPPAKSDPEEE